MLKDTFTCVVCHNDKILDNEIAPIAFSHVEDLSFTLMDLVPSFTLYGNHSHMSYFSIDFVVLGDVQMERRITMDDVFIYHAHNLFLCFFVCIELYEMMSTSIEHELTKRALESIDVSNGLNPNLNSFHVCHQTS